MFKCFIFVFINAILTHRNQNIGDLFSIDELKWFILLFADNAVLFEHIICQHCSMNMIENEYHFLLVCPKYNRLRIKYLPPVTIAIDQHFNTLMVSTSSHSKQPTYVYISVFSSKGENICLINWFVLKN